MIQRGTVTIHRIYFLEDDVFDGDFPRDDTRTDVYDDLTASEAAELICREGLTFAATGGAWAADPDGSYITDYAAGQRCETSAHLAGWPTRVEAAIADAVDAR